MTSGIVRDARIDPLLGVILAVGTVLLSAVVARSLVKPPPPGPPSSLATSHTSSAVSGRLLYLQHCANCHGATGLGDGIGAVALVPPPRDFTSNRWRFGLEPHVLQSVIANGIPGTGMPAFAASLSVEQRHAVEGYVRSLAPAEQEFTRRFQEAQAAAKDAGFEPAALPLPLPAFQFRDGKERPVGPGELRGRGTLIVFWSVDCAHCLKEFPAIAKRVDEFGKRGFRVVAVCCTDVEVEEAEALLGPSAKQVTVCIDPGRSHQTKFDVQAFPTMVLVDGEGRVVARKVGAPEWHTPNVARLIETCLPSPESAHSP